MKRKSHSVYLGTRSKKPKLESLCQKTTKEWIPATCIWNYMKNDHLVDWLKIHGKYSTSHFSNTHTYNKQANFTSFIMEKGCEFETELIKYINNNKINIVTVSEYINDESVNKTIKLRPRIRRCLNL